MIVYLITNQKNGKQYVGQSVRALSHRWSQHVKAAERGGITPFYKAIRKHKPESFVCEVIDTATTLEELNKKEIEWIAEKDCFAHKGTGYNCNIGGDNHSRTMPEEEKTIRRETLHRASVIRVEDGKIFESVKDAALELGVTAGFISSVLRGRKRSAKGFSFKYLSNEEANNEAQVSFTKKDKNIEKFFTSGRPVVCIDTGKEFKSVKQAAYFYGAKQDTNLTLHLKGKYKTFKKMVFTYKDQLGEK